MFESNSNTWSRGFFLLLIWAVCVFSGAMVSAQTLTSATQEQPFVVEYYYKAKWGYATEFINLFKKNHYPVLKKEMEGGRILQLKAETPFYHSTEDGRWDYRITITWKNSVVAHDNFDSTVITKKLFPDQETFQREEQRRFEILIAHWDVPIKSLDLDKK